MQLVGRAGDDRPWALAFSPPAGQPRQAPPDHVAREVLLGDADLPSPPSLAELVQVRDDDVAQGRRQCEVRQQTVEHRLRSAFVEVVERTLQRACELVQVRADRSVGPGRDVRRRSDRLRLGDRSTRRLRRRQPVGEVVLHAADPVLVAVGVEPEAAG